MAYTLHLGDCLDALKTLPDASVDAVVTDPPYELGFMGKKWDAAGIAYSVPLWTEALRVLKPGGHLLAFGGTRTYHRMACAIEDAGFEVRDSLHWVYGSGFPKSLDVSKAIDAQVLTGGSHSRNLKTAIANRPGQPRETSTLPNNGIKAVARFGGVTNDNPATDAAKEWHGWGTALKPAHEPVVVARKSLVGTVAANVLEHGTGAMNIDGCRVATADNLNGGAYSAGKKTDGEWGTMHNYTGAEFRQPKGRWPPNILLSHTPECGEACAEDCAVAEMDRQSGVKTGKGTPTVGGPPRTKSAHIQQMSEQPRTDAIMDYGDSGGASRFFPVFRYQAKASRSERNGGLGGFPESLPRAPNGAVNAVSEGRGSLSKPRANHHPTVKPVELMRWLVRLVTPRGGVVLDPFTGSGTTGVAAMLEGFRFVGIEREPEYHAIATARINHATRQETQLELSA